MNFKNSKKMFDCCRSNQKLIAILAMSAVLLTASLPALAKDKKKPLPSISAVSANTVAKEEGEFLEIQILGADFSDPEVTLGAASALSLIQPTSDELITMFHSVAAGDYKLTLRQGKHQVEYDLTIGAVGLQGEKGEKGDTGAQGEKGATGDTGAQGGKGATGDTGAQGERGLQGETGEACIVSECTAPTEGQTGEAILTCGDTLVAVPCFSYDDPATSKIAGFVWLDPNKDFTKTVSEPGLEGVRVTLLDSTSGEPIILQTTNTEGFYEFRGLGAGQYRVVVSDVNFLDRGLISTKPQSLDPWVDLSVGENVDMTNFGYADPGTSRISGQVWDDVNQDGDWTTDEPVANHVFISLTDSESSILYSRTDASGQFRFDNLKEGFYTASLVETTLPPGSFGATPASLSLQIGQDSIANLPFFLNSNP